METFFCTGEFFFHSGEMFVQGIENILFDFILKFKCSEPHRGCNVQRARVDRVFEPHTGQTKDLCFLFLCKECIFMQ